MSSVEKLIVNDRKNLLRDVEACIRDVVQVVRRFDNGSESTTQDAKFLRDLVRKFLKSHNRYFYLKRAKEIENDRMFVEINDRLPDAVVGTTFSPEELGWLHKFNIPTDKLEMISSALEPLANISSIEQVLQAVDEAKPRFYSIEIDHIEGSFSSFLDRALILVVGTGFLHHDGCRYYRRRATNFSVESIHHGATLLLRSFEELV